MSYLFTSESVSEGHPDKVADQISDAVLDNMLAQDPNSKVACETLVTTGQVIIAGEVKTDAWVDVPTVAREVINEIGYTKSDYKFDGDSCGVLSAIHEQSGDINRGVERRNPDDQGAGDQGMMFGYATKETKNLMPVALDLAHALVEELAVCSMIILPLRAQDRRLGTLTFFRCRPSEPYDERDMAFFTDLTYRAALAIENAMLHYQVKQLAMRDSLTGQYNRRAFFDLGRDEFSIAYNSRQPLAAMMLDIDHFKVINDTYGHALGDDILRMVIDFCRQNIRHTDILGRYGGDEYVILLPRTNLSTAVRIASRICKTIASKPFETKSGPVPVTVSLGVTEADSQTENIQGLLDLADKALYHAKRKTRNRVETMPPRANKQR